jgi:hypothetical protein
MQVTTITFGNLLKEKRILKRNKIIPKKKLFFENFSIIVQPLRSTVLCCPAPGVYGLWFIVYGFLGRSPLFDRRIS